MYQTLASRLWGRSGFYRSGGAYGLPAEWNEYALHYRYRNTFYHIRVVKMSEGATEVHRVVLDGVEQPDRSIHLIDDGKEHPAIVEVGNPPT